MDINIINVLVLAYMGDAVYEEFVRKYLIDKKISNVKELQEASLAYISAKSQARILEWLITSEILSEEELAVIKRARNAKGNHKPKSCDILTYKHATGLEALIGYLYLSNNHKRIEEIMNYILGGSVC